MMNRDLADPASESQREFETYRSLSMAAVVALVVGLLSLPAIVFSGLLFLSLVGVFLGLHALRDLAQRGDEMAGRGFAWAGLSLSLCSLIVGMSLAVYIYVTEVPPGYQRISYVNLQPDPRQPKLPVSPESLELDGEKIFVKGYIFPDDKSSDLKQFVLVPDRGTCCFGGQPALTDMILVTLRDPLRARYSLRQRKLGGILHVDTRKKPLSGLDGVYYQLDADYVK